MSLKGKMVRKNNDGDYWYLVIIGPRSSQEIKPINTVIQLQTLSLMKYSLTTDDLLDQTSIVVILMWEDPYIFPKSGFNR